MEEKPELAKKEPVRKKEDACKKDSIAAKALSKDIEKKKPDKKSISNIVKGKKSPDKVDGKKSIDNKLTGNKGARSMFGDEGYMCHLLKQREKMLDYSKLFSHLGRKRDNYNSYDSYSLAYDAKAAEGYAEHETISTEAVARIIEDSIVENMCGFSLNRTTLEEKEAFKVYAIFNQSLIQLKYSFGLG